MAKEILTALNILGLSEDSEATAEVVKRAFRERAKRCHPDVDASPDAATKFRELADAKDELLAIVDSNSRNARWYGTSIFEQIDSEIRRSRDSIFW